MNAIHSNYRKHLIEGAVALAIIAILFAVMIPHFKNAQVRAGVAQVQRDLTAIAQAMEAYNLQSPVNAILICEKKIRNATPSFKAAVVKPSSSYPAPFLSDPAYFRNHSEQGLTISVKAIPHYDNLHDSLIPMPKPVEPVVNEWEQDSEFIYAMMLCIPNQTFFPVSSQRNHAHYYGDYAYPVPGSLPERARMNQATG